MKAKLLMLAMLMSITSFSNSAKADPKKVPSKKDVEVCEAQFPYLSYGLHNRKESIEGLQKNETKLTLTQAQAKWRELSLCDLDCTTDDTTQLREPMRLCLNTIYIYYGTAQGKLDEGAASMREGASESLKELNKNVSVESGSNKPSGTAK